MKIKELLKSVVKRSPRAQTPDRTILRQAKDTMADASPPKKSHAQAPGAQSALTPPHGHAFNGPVHDFSPEQDRVQAFTVQPGQDFNLKVRYDYSNTNYVFKDAVQPKCVTVSKPGALALQTGGAYVTQVYTWTAEALSHGAKPFRINMATLYDEKYPLEVTVVD